MRCHICCTRLGSKKIMSILYDGALRSLAAWEEKLLCSLVVRYSTKTKFRTETKFFLAVLKQHWVTFTANLGRKIVDCWVANIDALDWCLTGTGNGMRDEGRCAGRGATGQPWTRSFCGFERFRETTTTISFRCLDTNTIHPILHAETFKTWMQRGSSGSDSLPPSASSVPKLI